MAIPVFDKNNNLHHFETMDVASICKEEQTRRNIALVGNNEFYLPHTIAQINILLSPLGFYQINKNQIINPTLIDKYNTGKITIGERDYYLSKRRITSFEDIYFPD